MEINNESSFEVAAMPERLDTLSAPGLERDLLAILDKGVTRLACDFSGTKYVASAGLRVMLMMFKKLKAVNGSFVLLKLPKEVYDVFKLSGFAQLMDIRDAL